MIKQRMITGFIALAVVVAVLAPVAEAGEWAIDTAHSVLDFKVRHLFSNTGGKFDDWSGSIHFDPAHPEKGHVELTIQTASINTENADRDGHLKSPDFFNVEVHPTIEFKSTKIEKKASKFVLVGDLTMNGVTKEISFPFEFGGAGNDPWGNMRAGFSAELKLDRKEFGLEWNKAIETGGMILGDEVKIEIEIEAVKKSA